MILSEMPILVSNKKRAVPLTCEQAISHRKVFYDVSRSVRWELIKLV